MIECDGEDDHVHLLVQYPSKGAVSRLVNSLKAVSSRLLRENRPEITGRSHKGVLWSPSYVAASRGGAPLSVIADDVTSQREAARGRSRLPPLPQGRDIPARFEDSAMLSTVRDWPRPCCRVPGSVQVRR